MSNAEIAIMASRLFYVTPKHGHPSIHYRIAHNEPCRKPYLNLAGQTGWIDDLQEVVLDKSAK
jgi:hypothetical protein